MSVHEKQQREIQNNFKLVAPFISELTFTHCTDLMMEADFSD